MPRLARLSLAGTRAPPLKVCDTTKGDEHQPKQNVDYVKYSPSLQKPKYCMDFASNRTWWQPLE